MWIINFCDKLKTKYMLLHFILGTEALASLCKPTTFFVLAKPAGQLHTYKREKKKMDSSFELMDLEVALEEVGSLEDSSWVLGAREDLDSSTDLMDLEEELEAVGSLHSSSWVLGRVDYRKDESYSEWARRIEWEATMDSVMEEEEEEQEQEEEEEEGRKEDSEDSEDEDEGEEEGEEKAGEREEEE